MNTWIFRVGALLTAGLLAGCDEVQRMSFAAGLDSLGSVSAGRKLTRSTIAGGDIVLRTPDGYCIDSRSVHRSDESSFALIARCDTLGAKGSYGDYELALITVTTVPLAPGAAAPTIEDLARSAGTDDVLSTRSSLGVPLVRFASGAHDLDSVSPEHWRGAFVLNGHLVGLSLYAPDNSPALRDTGAQLLSELAVQTRRASAGASDQPSANLTE